MGLIEIPVIQADEMPIKHQESKLIQVLTNFHSFSVEVGEHFNIRNENQNLRLLSRSALLLPAKKPKNSAALWPTLRRRMAIDTKFVLRDLKYLILHSFFINKNQEISAEARCS